MTTYIGPPLANSRELQQLSDPRPTAGIRRLALGFSTINAILAGEYPYLITAEGTAGALSDAGFRPSGSGNGTIWKHEDSARLVWPLIPSTETEVRVRTLRNIICAIAIESDVSLLEAAARVALRSVDAAIPGEIVK